MVSTHIGGSSEMSGHWVRGGGCGASRIGCDEHQFEAAPVEENPTRICELIVDLGDVEILGVDDAPGGPLALHIRTRARQVCGGCGEAVWSKGNSPAGLVDLAAFGRPVLSRRGRPPVRPLRRPGISPAQRPWRATSNWTVIPRLSSASFSRRSGRRRTQAAEPRSHPQDSTMGANHVKMPIPGPQAPSGKRDK